MLAWGAKRVNNGHMKKTQKPNLLSLKDFLDANADIVTERQMRRFIQEKRKGIESWLRYVGKRIFVDVDQFFEWIKLK